jgi:hypothetical protein
MSDSAQQGRDHVVEEIIEGVIGGEVGSVTAARVISSVNALHEAWDKLETGLYVVQVCGDGHRHILSHAVIIEMGEGEQHN